MEPLQAFCIEAAQPAFGSMFWMKSRALSEKEVVCANACPIRVSSVARVARSDVLVAESIVLKGAGACSRVCSIEEVK